MRVRVGRIWGVASEAFMLAAPDWNTTTLARKRIRKNAEASRPGQFMYTSLLEAIGSNVHTLEMEDSYPGCYGFAANA